MKNLLMLGACLPAMAFVAGSPALAQDTAPAEQQGTQAQPQESGLEEIVVTAQRTEARMQDVPVAITAFSSASLVEKGISNSQGLQIATPGLQMVQNGLASSPYLRGVGAESASIGGVEAPVAIYVDGIYYPENAANIFSFNNVARVEVLKGPQGTLFGRNSTGGLISITTRDPQVSPSAEGSLSYGNYDTVEGNAYITGGSGNVAADLAVYGIHNNGYGENLIDGRPNAVERTISARSKILWTPSDEDRFTFMADYTKDNGTLGLGQRSAVGSILFDGQTTPGGPYDLNSDVSPRKSIKTYTIAMKYSHEFDWGTFSSLSAYRNSDIHYIWDVDGTPIPILPVDVKLKSTSFQEELLFTGKAGKLKWTAGVFIYDAKADEDLNIFPSAIPTANYNLPAVQNTRSYAAFAQGTYEVLPDTNFTAGFRYTIDERQIAGNLFALPGNPAPAGTLLQSLIDKKTFKSPSWRLSVDHKFTPDILAYVSYDRGFKSGTFNVGALNQPAVDPEKLDSIEVGFKSDLFDRLLRFNVAAFHYKYSGIQLGSTDNQGNALILNAASAKVDGMEIETTLAPRLEFGRLQLNAGLALLNGRYSDFPNGPLNTPLPTGGNVQSFGDLSGNRMTHAPKWTLTLGGTFAVPVAGGELSMSGTYFHSAPYYWDSENRFQQKGFDLVNGQVAYKFADDRYSVFVYGKNLTNTHYYANVLFGAGDGSSYAPPRRYGAGFTFKF